MRTTLHSATKIASCSSVKFKCNLPTYQSHVDPNIDKLFEENEKKNWMNYNQVQPRSAVNLKYVNHFFIKTIENQLIDTAIQPVLVCYHRSKNKYDYNQKLKY